MEKKIALLQTGNHIEGLVSRITLGIVLLAHGCQMLLGWFGGYGFAGTMNYLTQSVGLNWLIACMVIFLQFFGSLLLLIGLGTRPVSIGIFFMFIGMIVTAHLDFGFFMNWNGNQKGEGFEYHLLVLGLTITLFLKGSGRFSMDRILSH